MKSVQRSVEVSFCPAGLKRALLGACGAKRLVRCAQDRCILVQYNKDGNLGKLAAEFLLVGKRANETSLLQLGQDFQPDPTCDVHASEGEDSEGHVPCLGTVSLHPDMQRFFACRAGPGECLLRDFGGWI